MEPRQEMCSKWESLRSRNGKHPESKFRAVSQLLSEACSDGTGNACVQHGGGTNRPTRRQMEKPFQGPLTSKTQPIPSPRQSLCLSLTASQKFQLQLPQTQTDTHFPLFPCHTDLSSVQPPLFPHRPSTMTSPESRQ